MNKEDFIKLIENTKMEYIESFNIDYRENKIKDGISSFNCYDKQHELKNLSFGDNSEQELKWFKDDIRKELDNIKLNISYLRDGDDN